MALEYELTLAGQTPVNQVAARALPLPDERPAGTAPLLAADLYDRYGFECIFLAGENGYVEAEQNGTLWSWEPPAYVSVTFRLDKFADRPQTILNMLTVIQRLLSTGPEDASLTQNGDTLLLTRMNGAITKHSPAWWTSYPGASEALPLRG